MEAHDHPHRHHPVDEGGTPPGKVPAGFLRFVVTQHRRALDGGMHPTEAASQLAAVRQHIRTIGPRWRMTPLGPAVRAYIRDLQMIAGRLA